MNSLTWSQIETVQPRPETHTMCSLTAPTDDKLVLHGGMRIVSRSPVMTRSDTWILDLTSHSLRRYTSTKDHTRVCHTGSLGLNSCVTIIGGFMTKMDTCEVYESVFHVMFGPKSLQQLAMQMIQKYQDDLPWSCLPMKLISQLGISTK